MCPSKSGLYLILATLLLTGCGDRELVVEADKTWTGRIITDGVERMVTGNGDRTFADLGEGRICWWFAMNSNPPVGEISAYMRVPGILSSDKRGFAIENGPSRVEGCSDD